LFNRRLQVLSPALRILLRPARSAAAERKNRARPLESGHENSPLTKLDLVDSRIGFASQQERTVAAILPPDAMFLVVRSTAIEAALDLPW